jgi:hypothetical protein
VSETTGRLAWTQGEYGILTGRAGKVALFTIAYRTVRTDPEHVMQSRLPGFDGLKHRWKHDSVDALKAKAEALLAAWLKEVNGG